MSYVRSVHSNQSRIEGFFSRVRHMHKDRTDQYASGVVQQNIINERKTANRIKKGNSSYPDQIIGEEVSKSMCKSRNGTRNFNKISKAGSIIIPTVSEIKPTPTNIVPEDCNLEEVSFNDLFWLHVNL